MVKQGAVEPLFDLMGCGMQSTALSGTGSTGCISCKELEFVRSSGEAEEFDGKMLDSSVARNKPNVFPLDKVIPGWSEGVQLMVQGEKTRFWVPEELAYKGRPDRPQGMLVFDVELVGVMW